MAKRTISSSSLLICTVGTLLSPAQNLSQGLTACYALNGNATETVNNLHGNMSTAVAPTVDRFNTANSALYFSGSPASMVKLPSSPLIKPNSLTFSAWYKPSQVVPMDIIFTKNTFSSFIGSYCFALENVGGTVRWGLWRQDGSSSEKAISNMQVSTTNWIHAICCIDLNCMKLYINGQLEDSITTNINSFNYHPTKEVIVGGTDELADNSPYKGSIDNLKFYNRMLTSGEAMQLYLQDPLCTGGSQPQPPISVFASNSTSFCPGGIIWLTDQSTNNPNAWLWQVSGIGTSTLQNPSFAFGAAGLYTVSLKATNTAGASANTASQVITVYPNPVMSFSHSKSVYCPGDVVSIQASGAVSYIWYTNGGQSPGSTYTTMATGINQTITVKGVNQHGCESFATASYAFSEKCGGVPTGIGEKNLTVMKCRTGEAGDLVLTGLPSEDLVVTVTDLTGRTVVRRNSGAGEYLQIGLGGQAQGIYLVTVTGREVSRVFRVFKE
jgi:PKD repeat protein